MFQGKRLKGLNYIDMEELSLFLLYICIQTELI